MTRETEIRLFLDQSGWGEAARAPITGDASSRRYERLDRAGEKAILMDAPLALETQTCPADASPEMRKRLGYNATARLAGSEPRAFIALAQNLTQRGFSAPHIYGWDMEKGLLILEDLGGDDFAKVLDKDITLERQIYGEAAKCLGALYRSTFASELRVSSQNSMPKSSSPDTQDDTQEAQVWSLMDYDETALLAEVDLLLEWYAPAFEAPISARAKQDWYAIWTGLFSHLNVHAKGLALRDFHAENIFWLPERDGVANIGLIDFQDGLMASPTYDLVSLLEDARRDVSSDYIDEIKRIFCQAAGLEQTDQFERAYAVQAAQRNAKILGIFVRLSKRDNKPHYQTLLPRVKAHFASDISHPDLADLKSWIGRYLPSLLDL